MSILWESRDRLKIKIWAIKMKKFKDSITRRYDEMIRDRAISRAKSKIALQGKTKSDFTEQQILDIVAEEERDLRSSVKTRALYGVVAFLGFGIV